jgi:hypothetical protein
MRKSKDDKLEDGSDQERKDTHHIAVSFEILWLMS